MHLPTYDLLKYEYLKNVLDSFHAVKQPDLNKPRLIHFLLDKLVTNLEPVIVKLCLR